MKKRILWKSDLWPFTVTFGIMTAFCLLMLLLHALGEHASSGEVMSSALVAAIPGVITLVLAFTDRSEAMEDRLSLYEFINRPDLAALRKGTMLDPEHPVIASHIQNPPTLV